MAALFPDISELLRASERVRVIRSADSMSWEESGACASLVLSRLSIASKALAPGALAAAALPTCRTPTRTPPRDQAEPPAEPEPAWLPSSPRKPSGGSGAVFEAPGGL